MKYIFLAAGVLLQLSMYAQKEIKARHLKRDVAFLADDKLEGRWPGSPADYTVRTYIENAFRKAGIMPLVPGYEQRFAALVKLSAPVAENQLLVVGNTGLKIGVDYMVMPFSGNGTLKAPVIFCNDNSACFNELNVSPGKWIVLWRKKTIAPASDSASDYAQARLAMEKGAAGVLLVSPDSLDKKDNLVRLRPRKDSALQIPVLQIKRTAWAVLKTALNGGQPDGFISHEELTASVLIEPAYVNPANIVGLIEGKDPLLKNEYIVLGAHYDHLGWGGPGTGSLKPDTVAIHNGADDNASGTSALLNIARALSRQKKNLKRSVIIIAFAAEEEGLLGSDYFVKHLPIPDTALKVMLNMDMVGRLNSENQLYMGGAGTFPGGVEMMKNLTPGSGLHPVIHAGGVGGSDHVSFYRRKISSVGFHTGGHPQYHTPADDAGLINAAGMEKVARYIYRAVFTLCNRTEPFGFIAQD